MTERELARAAARRAGDLFNDRLQEWEDFYNYNRPHGGLGGQTPYESYGRRPRALCE